MFDFKRACITLGIGDYFNQPMAINSQYLAITDSYENKVIIYTPNRFGKWLKSKEILPPENSTPYKYEEGFGTKLYLNKNFLAIEATIFKRVNSDINIDDFTYVNGNTATFLEVYLFDLYSDFEVRIETTETINLTKKNENIRFYELLFKQKIRKIIVDRNDKYRFSAIANYSNLFLIGHASRYRGGEAWLYNLNMPQNAPKIISAPDLYIGTTVAVSKHFIAMGDIGTLMPPPQDAPFLKSKTLVRAIENGSTSIIDSYGKVSLSDNILAVMRDSAQGHRVALLEVFRLDSNAVPRLILKRKNIKRAFVQNGFLVTVEKRRKILKIYIKLIV